MRPWLCGLGLAAFLCVAPARGACVGSAVTLSSYSSFSYAAAYSTAGGCTLTSVKWVPLAVWAKSSCLLRYVWSNQQCGRPLLKCRSTLAVQDEQAVYVRSVCF